MTMGMASLARSLIRRAPFAANDSRDQQPQMGMNPNQIVGQQQSDYAPVMGRQSEAQMPQTSGAQAMGMNQPGPGMMRLLQPTQQEQQYQQLMQRGPTQHGQGSEHGLWSRIKDVGMGMAMAARNAPEGQKGLALLGGGAGAAVNPQIAHNLQFQAQVPYAAQMAQASRGPLDAELERRMGYAKMYGHDPETGQPTMGAQTEEDRKANQEILRQIQLMNANANLSGKADLARHRGVLESQGADKVSIAQARSKVSAFNALMRAHQMTPDQLQEAADNLGIDIPEGTDPQVHDLKVDAQGHTIRVGRVGGAQDTGVKSIEGAKLNEQRKRTGIMQQNADTNRQRAGTYDRTAGQGRSVGGTKLVEGDYKAANRYETAKSAGDSEAMSRYRARLESKGFTFDDKGNMTYPPQSQKQSGQGNRTAAQKTISATSLPALLNHADVKARGIKDINGLRKDLAAHGYTVVE